MMIRNAIGPYQLVRPLGAGAMGEVVLGIAHGASGFARQVAIKLIHSELLADPALEKMFIREATLGGRVHHRNVVGVLGFGVDDGAYYLVLEYADGRDLAAHLERKRLTEELALYVACELALGLHHLHTLADERGLPLDVIHRDLRPGNVVVSRTGDVKIADLGLAKIAAHMVYTVSGMRKGTYRYMSPEQLAGERLTAASDQFAFGIMLAELLRGARPFADANPIELRDVLRQGPALDGIPDDIRAVVARTLALAPEDRFGSMDAVRHAIEALQEVRPRAGAADFGGWVAAD